MKIEFKKNQKGMTLMETIIALGILIFGIVSSLALMTSSLTYSQSSEQMIVAVNLAREGLEIVRSVKSLEGFDAVGTGYKIAKIDYLDGALSLETASNNLIVECANCVLDLYNGRYLHDSPGDATTFRRMLTITNAVAGEKKVISRIYWQERGREHQFVLEDHITNW